MSDENRQNEEKLTEQIVEETMKEIVKEVSESLEEQEQSVEQKENTKEQKADAKKELHSEADSEQDAEKDAEQVSAPDVKELTSDSFEQAEQEESLESEILFLNDEEDSMEEKLEKHRHKKKVRNITLGVIGAILVLYLGISTYFINHFYFGTTINDTKFSCKTVKAVESYMQEQVKNYELTMIEREQGREVIRGVDVDLEYKKNDSLQKLLEKQNPFLWFTAFFSDMREDAVVEVDYNKEKLDALMASLDCMKAENQVAPVSAKPVFQDGTYVIQPETLGKQIDQERFKQILHEYVGQFHRELDLEKETCYVLPKFTSESKEVVEAQEKMQQYLGASITYKVDPVVVVNSELISQWVTVDEEMNVVFSEDAMNTFVNELCSNYNTAGKVRTITTPTGKTAQVSGGSYGWKIHKEKERQELKKNIEAKEVVEREPIYAQKAAAHGANDWGTTYLEVDLTTQHMWFVKNGAVALETDVVTGRPIPERVTPQGVYTILEKMRNKTLRGDRKPDGKYEYETPVAYWLRVTWTGIGFHDATWQSKFGGDVYKTLKGSHGCINMPLDKAGALYGMVDVGCPVIVHY